MTYSDELREFIKGWEAPSGALLEPHWDDIGKVWDIGFGHVLHGDEDRREITTVEAELLLDWDLHLFDDGVSSLVTVPIAQCCYDALVSFSYNVGLRALGASTLLGYVNDCRDDEAAAQFMEWVRAKGKIIPGLVKRRNAEREMYLYGSYEGRP